MGSEGIRNEEGRGIFERKLLWWLHSNIFVNA